MIAVCASVDVAKSQRKLEELTGHVHAGDDAVERHRTVVIEVLRLDRKCSKEAL
jgi:hypothetical protein